MKQPTLFPMPAGEGQRQHANIILEASHYLGAVDRGVAWLDEFGIAVFHSPPTSRRLPVEWVELMRWCLFGIKNGGSQQWARMRRWLLSRFPLASTVVSYSDPSAGHTGALYRACGWQWAPTWHRLVPPPTGNGDWGTGPQGPKDRWLFSLRPDDLRVGVVELDSTYRHRFPWAVYPNADPRRQGEEPLL